MSWTKNIMLFAYSVLEILLKVKDTAVEIIYSPRIYGANILAWNKTKVLLFV